MTKRLYYHDSFLREFDATVVRREPAPDGRTRVWLDQTAFYPTSGGQPHDLGTLGSQPVLDVSEDESGNVVHLLERDADSQSVHGVVDWPRRFDHMQQHTGQHVLSAAFVRLFKLPTVSFHLGTDVCTIDLGTQGLSARQLDAAESLANQVVFEDRPVRIEFTSEVDEAARRKVEREGELRVIDVEDFDRCPCGGTHVSRTGQIGLILARGVEKVKQQVRIEFACGGRALAAAHRDHKRLVEAARLLTTGAAELPEVIRKQFEERRESERAKSKLLERLAELEAGQLLAEAERVGDRRLVSKIIPEADAGYLRQLAARLAKEAGVQILLASRAQPAAVVFAQTPGLPTDMNALLREVLEKYGGKGGGSRDFAQGALTSADSVEEALRAARVRLES